MKTAFELGTTTVLEELMRIAEAVVLIALFVAAGKALDQPLAYAAGGLLYVVTCLYVGIRVDTLVAYARYGDGRRRFTKRDLLFGIAASTTFAAWMIKVLQAVLQFEGLS